MNPVKDSKLMLQYLKLMRQVKPDVVLYEESLDQKTIEKSAEHASEIIPGIARKLSSAVWNILVKATESTEAFNRFVNSRRKVLVKPLRKSANEYIRMELETALSVQEIIKIVKTDMGV